MTRVAVTSVLSQTGFGAILGATDEDGRPLRVRTREPFEVAVGDVLDVGGEEGRYDGRHGVVIQIDAVRVATAPASGRLLVPWLCQLPGIGRVRARRLLDALGDDLLTALRDRSRLDEIGLLLDSHHPAAGGKLARRLFVQLASRDATAEVGMAEGEFMRRLEALGVGDLRAAKKLWRLIGSVDAYQRLVERPYLAASLLPWPKVEAIGRALLAQRMPESEVPHHPDRLVGAVDAVWRDTLARGSTACTMVDMERRLERLSATPNRAIRLALTKHRAREADDLLRAPGASHLEATVAEHIARLRGSAAALAAPAIPPDAVRGLNGEQRDAVAFVAARPLSILHGGAGVGKTTTMRAICAVHEAAGRNVVLCAISGKASLRLSRATGRIAQTIARLLLALDAQAANEGPHELPDHQRIDADTLLVVDEASMVDLASWSRLLAHVPAGARVVVTGDPGQLPPVGLGRVFHDMVEDGTDVVELCTVVRQGADNPIIACARDIREGRTPALPAFAGAEIGVFHVDCPPDRLEATALEVRGKFAGTGDQILTVAGRNATCDALARAIQAERRASGIEGRRLGPRLPWVSVGEPVVVTANRYAEALTNGLIGTVVDLESGLFHFDGEPGPRVISPEALWDIASGWCVTAHRAQGSEAERVVVLLDAPGMMTREWLYTAVTRATRQVVLVGPRANLLAAVARRESRVTGFPLELARIRRGPA